MWKRLLLIPVIAAPLCAQQRGPSPASFAWWDSPLANGLNLSDAQSKQIRATVSEYRGRLADLRAAVDKSEGSLEAVLNEDTVDQRKAGEAIDQLVSARGELFRTNSQLALKLRMILTADQWQDLQSRQRGRGRPGPGPRRRGPGQPPASGSAPLSKGGPPPAPSSASSSKAISSSQR
jgi:Spy/CpxP family protein refolding chaperone